MTFDEVLEQVRELLQSKGRVAYRALKRRFELDDEYLEDLKAELIDAEHVARDEEGKVLVWTGTSPGSGSTFQVSGSQPPVSSPQTLDSRLDAAERRQLTVMFCDLVGSTALSTQLDPEELREVVRAYQETCTEVIRRYDGHIAQHLGDGLLVYFGYPVAHEDDAQRAVRAGLEIVAAIQKTVPLSLSGRARFSPSPVSTGEGRGEGRLQVRIGIHTGLVVVGEIGSSDKRESLALGETPNVAARLQALAEPDTVVLSAATQRLVQGFFACQDRGPQELKGITTPISVYRVLGESGAQSRFDVAVRTGLTPLVGREEEVELLRRRWERVRVGEGQVVLLGGEPGIGKSRLVQVLREQTAKDSPVGIECRCSPYYQNSALYPVIEHLQRWLRLGRDETHAVKLQKLEQSLASYDFPLPETVPLIAPLLSIALPEHSPPLPLSPQKQKEKTLEALVTWLRKEAERQPTRVEIEDLHWADPSTVEWLTLLLEQVPTMRMLVVLTFRPEFSLPWPLRAHMLPLTLGRLSPQHIERMAQRVAGKALPAEVIHQLVSKTDGVPLFVEEMTKNILESGLLQESNGHYELTGPLSQLAIPVTLQDSLMARLDRLGPAKEVAQMGATLGREFSYELLQSVSSVEETRLQQGLKQLVEAELVYQKGLPPQAQYLFKHALVQDVAYQSLLQSTRQRYHRQAAQVLEGRFPETKETRPELLAHHYTEASLIAQAVPYWQKAGRKAIGRSANVEAISYLTKGLELLKTLRDTPERAQHELTLQVTLGPVLIATKGYAAPEVGKVYTRARELCRKAGETRQLLPVLAGLSTFFLVRAELETTRELMEQFLRLSQKGQNPADLQVAHYVIGEVLFHWGELTQARTHLEQGLTLYDPQKRPSSAWNDPGVACLCIAAYALWSLGYPDQALKRCHEALTLAQELSHPFSLAFALYGTIRLHQFRREVEAARQYAKTLIVLSTEQGFAHRVASGIMLQGWALAEQGQGEEGVAQIRQGLAAHQATGAELYRPYFLAILAEAYGRGGQAEEGLRAVSEALTLVNKTGERFYEAELYRLKGQLTLQSQVQGPKSKVENSLESSVQSLESEAEGYFQKAIEIARRQQAKSLELRAVMSLSRLWQQQGKKEESRQMLAEIYHWFTEGFDTKDLQEAKALLEELS